MGKDVLVYHKGFRFYYFAPAIGMLLLENKEINQIFTNAAKSIERNYDKNRNSIIKFMK